MNIDISHPFCLVRRCGPLLHYWQMIVSLQLLNEESTALFIAIIFTSNVTYNKPIFFSVAVFNFGIRTCDLHPQEKATSFNKLFHILEVNVAHLNTINPIYALSYKHNNRSRRSSNIYTYIFIFYSWAL